jgi:hypothetical protein
MEMSKATVVFEENPLATVVIESIFLNPADVPSLHQ